MFWNGVQELMRSPYLLLSKQSNFQVWEAPATILAIFRQIVEEFLPASSVFLGDIKNFFPFMMMIIVLTWWNRCSTDHLEWEILYEVNEKFNKQSNKPPNFLEMKRKVFSNFYEEKHWSLEYWFFERNFLRVKEWIPATISQFRLVTRK